jgi:NAD(P)H-nitrite reductase large subunit
MCKWWAQDSLGLTEAIHEKMKDRIFPAKVKIGISGCQRCCSESQVRDIGINGTTKGWMVFFGGNVGTKPRIGNLIAWGLSESEAIDCADRLLSYYGSYANPKERTARFVERIGMNRIKTELLVLLPYIPVDNI